MRDTTFTLQALHFLNLDWEADEFMQFVADLEANEDGALQIMYGIDGRRDLTRSTRDELSGYAGASPVRIGNGAFDQRQNDVFGAVLDSIMLHTQRSQQRLWRLWPIVQAQAECATKVWREPDRGIWEARGAPRHYVSSKLMCWVALDRAAQLGAIAGDPELEASWRASAEEIRADILEHGVRDGVLRQRYETDALDASTLLAAIFGFLPGDDETLRRSVEAIADELTGRVRAALPHRRDRRRALGQGGSFLICSFWLVSALAIVGAEQRARDMMERLLRSHRRSGSTPKSSTPAPAATSATSPRPSPPGPDRSRGADHPRRAAARVLGMSDPPRVAGAMSSSSAADPAAWRRRAEVRRSSVEVALVDRKNHRLFQPLLPRRRAGPEAERAQRVDGGSLRDPPEPGDRARAPGPGRRPAEPCGRAISPGRPVRQYPARCG